MVAWTIPFSIHKSHPFIPTDLVRDRHLSAHRMLSVVCFVSVELLFAHELNAGSCLVIGTVCFCAREHNWSVGNFPYNSKISKMCDGNLAN